MTIEDKPWDELARPKPARLAPLVLDMLGVAELRDYIDELRAEVARVEQDIIRKQSHRGAAEAVFRRS